MRKLAYGVLVTMGITAVTAVGMQPTQASQSTTDPGSPGAVHRQDNLQGPLTEQRNELRRQAIEKVAKGQATPNDEGVVEVANGKFVEVETTKQDTIFTILSEFGEDGSQRYGAEPGPKHNEIPKPDRSVDNSTIWQQDFDKAHYETLFNGDGESMRTYYEDVSNGAYSVTNEVTDWVTVPHNGSWYGDNTREYSGGVWEFVQDSGDAWWDAQIAAGKTPAEIDAYLAQFDAWDRYDWDQDGDFNEADGYIDHFQAVHSGEGEEAGGGVLGGDAIWSHRWYVNGDDYGVTGPMVDGTQNKLGGARIGDSKYFFGDYTTEPENGGLGVFAHEYGHDLGLPDYYDTSGGGENSAAFWTLMSSGSWLGHGASANDGIGTVPGLLGAEEKMFLGWLDYSTADTGTSGDYTLNPSQFQGSDTEQAVRVNLPDKTTSTTYATPPSGSHAWWTGSADDLNESLTRTVPATSRVTVTADAWYSIEANYDYLYGEYSLDGGKNWERAGMAIDGDSRGRWSNLRFSYQANGQETLFRFRYQTDGAVHHDGAFLDNIVIKSGGTTLFNDNVEQGVNGWAADGMWKRSTGTETGTFERYYLLENRQYTGWDTTLANGPYNFSKGHTAPSWVEYFSFQNGMLVWYVDDSYADNNTSQHPGGAAAMVVDARPEPFTYDDGTRPTNRRQPFDATFGLEATDRTCLHKEVVEGRGKDETVVTKEACAPSSAGIPVFDDSDPSAYYSEDNPYASVKVAGHGVAVTVTGTSRDNLDISVVNPTG